ncbi:recombination-associated protein [Aeromonas phage phiA034]|uniref:Recombination-associated protein n=1 Tax=Aeromonas phage phiA034 TaxID=2985287 RepID=A0AAE9YK51_9CAUD|nr:recombination-associated protein [Aeromonas phage phiA034]
MAKISQHLNKAIIFSLAPLAETNVSEIIDAFKEDRTLKQLNSLGVDRINAVLLSLSGVNNDPDWAKETAVRLSHYLGFEPINDPADSNYRAWGFSPISAAEGDEDYNGKPAYAVAVPGSTAIMVYAEVRERVLPSVSINTELAKRVSEFERKEERAANNKDVAILKEQVVASMLKTAPIRPKQVPVLFYKGLVVFFTSSAKTAEDASGLFRKVLGTFPAQKISQEGRLLMFFREMVLNSAHIPQDLTTADQEELDHIRFLPGEDAKLVDTNDGATYTIKGESLSVMSGTAYPMLKDRMEVEIAEMGFAFYPQGAGCEETRASGWEVKMSDKGYIKKFGPLDKSTEPVSLIERRTQHYQENATGLAAGWERGIATIWIIAEFLDSLLVSMTNASALIGTDLGLGYTTPEDDERHHLARYKYLQLRAEGYKARFNATLELDPSLAKRRDKEIEDDQAPESPDPDQKIYWKDEWGNYGTCDTDEEFEYLLDLDEGHERITRAEYMSARDEANEEEAEEDDGEI